MCEYFFEVNILNSIIRIKSKYLLLRNTIRLFLVAMVSEILRWGLTFLVTFGIYRLTKTAFIFDFKNNILDTIFYIFGFILAFFVCVAVTTFAAAVRMGEQFIFFSRAEGAKGRFALLFHFCTFKKSIRALSFYLKLNILKFGWLVYYLLPPTICIGIIFYLYNYAHLSFGVFMILTVGTSALISLSLFMWRTTVFRYSAAPYYMCLNPKMSPKSAINKSIRFTDGYLREGVLLESSFLGWIASCVTIIPIFYVIPYCRLCRAVAVSQYLANKTEAPKKQQYTLKTSI